MITWVQMSLSNKSLPTRRARVRAILQEAPGQDRVNSCWNWGGWNESRVKCFHTHSHKMTFASIFILSSGISGFMTLSSVLSEAKLNFILQESATQCKVFLLHLVAPRCLLLLLLLLLPSPQLRRSRSSLSSRSPLLYMR